MGPIYLGFVLVKRCWPLQQLNQPRNCDSVRPKRHLFYRIYLQIVGANTIYFRPAKNDSKIDIDSFMDVRL